MSTLHATVAHAIAGSLERTVLRADMDGAAAAAIREVLAEAERAIEALPEGLRKGDVRRAEVLAALAALAGEQA